MCITDTSTTQYNFVLPAWLRETDGRTYMYYTLLISSCKPSCHTFIIYYPNFVKAFVKRPDRNIVLFCSCHYPTTYWLIHIQNQCRIHNLDMARSRQFWKQCAVSLPVITTWLCTQQKLKTFIANSVCSIIYWTS